MYKSPITWLSSQCPLIKNALTSLPTYPTYKATVHLFTKVNKAV